MVPGVAERLLVVGAVPRIERAGSGVDLFHAPLVAGIRSSVKFGSAAR